VLWSPAELCEDDKPHKTSQHDKDKSSPGS